MSCIPEKTDDHIIWARYGEGERFPDRVEAGRGHMESNGILPDSLLVAEANHWHEIHQNSSELRSWRWRDYLVGERSDVVTEFSA